MTVVNSVGRIRHIGNGTTKAFSVPFKFLLNIDKTAQLKVTVSGDDAIKTLKEGIDYTVVGGGEQNGGTITLVEAPSENQRIVILRNMPFVQNTNFDNGEAFDAEKYEDSLDEIVMTLQQMNDDISRAVLIDPFSEEKPNTLIEQILGYRNEAVVAANEALVSKNLANASEKATEEYTSMASASATNAAVSADNALSSETNALKFANAASDSAISAQESAEGITAAVVTASQAADDASGSANVAAVAATNALNAYQETVLNADKAKVDAEIATAQAQTAQSAANRAQDFADSINPDNFADVDLGNLSAAGREVVEGIGSVSGLDYQDFGTSFADGATFIADSFGDVLFEAVANAVGRGIAINIADTPYASICRSSNASTINVILPNVPKGASITFGYTTTGTTITKAMLFRKG